MSIYLTGDTHRGGGIDRIQRVPDDCEKLIVCGDFGMPFQVSRDGVWSDYDLYLGSIYDRLPYEVIFVDGNHENFDYLDNVRVTTRFNGKVNKISKNVTRLRRGELYNVDGKTIWTFGGAMSTDAMLRIEGVGWWRSEVASQREMEHGLKTLKQVGNKVDYIITHTPPETIIDVLGINSVHCPVAKYLDEVLSRVEYKQWYCGHMHVDECLPDYKMSLLYYDIIKIGD